MTLPEFCSNFIRPPIFKSFSIVSFEWCLSYSMLRHNSFISVGGEEGHSVSQTFNFSMTVYNNPICSSVRSSDRVCKAILVKFSKSWLPFLRSIQSTLPDSWSKRSINSGCLWTRSTTELHIVTCISVCFAMAKRTASINADFLFFLIISFTFDFKDFLNRPPNIFLGLDLAEAVGLAVLKSKEVSISSPSDPAGEAYAEELDEEVLDRFPSLLSLSSSCNFTKLCLRRIFETVALSFSTWAFDPKPWNMFFNPIASANVGWELKWMRCRNKHLTSPTAMQSALRRLSLLTNASSPK